MKLKPLEYCLITWVTHNSRISERMVQFLPPDFIEGLKPIILDKNQQFVIAKSIIDKANDLILPIITFNVLPDHVHFVTGVVKPELLTNLIGQIKGYSSYVFCKKIDIPSNLWAQKFNRKWITSDESLAKVIAYVRDNHLKHEPSWGKAFLCGFEDEFQKMRDEV